MATADAPFLQAIADHPEDDGPRLVFADWLDEHGDADRAAFIRVQCDLARLPDDDPRRPGLAQRERDLLSRHRRDWLGERVPADGIKFCRGFIAKISATLSDYLAAADIWERFASVHTLTVRRDPALSDRFEFVLDSANVRRRLNAFVDELRASGLSQLWSGLRWPADQIAPSVLTRLKPPDLPRLELLDLHHGRLVAPLPVEDRGDGLYAVKPAFARLTTLGLSAGVHDGRGDFVMGQIAASENLANLRHLDYSANGLTDFGLRELAETPYVIGLRSLGLAHNQLTRAGVQFLAQSSFALTELDLSHNAGIEDAALAELADAAVFAKLTRLDLTGNDFGDAGLLRLLDSPNIAGLEFLAPGGLRVTEEGISALASAEHLTALQHLDLTGVRLTSDAAKALARARLPHLSELRVRGGGLDGEAAHALRDRFGSGLKMVSFEMAR